MNRKEHIEEIARDFLEKKYGDEYCLTNLIKGESPDYTGKKLDCKSFGLEICEATSFPFLLLFDKGSKPKKNIKNIDEIKTGVDKILPMIAVDLNDGKSKAYTYTGEMPNIGKELVEKAIKTITEHYEKLQQYKNCDTYELAIILPAFVIGDNFDNFVLAISQYFPKMFNTDKKYFKLIHFVDTGYKPGTTDFSSNVKSFLIEPL